METKSEIKPPKSEINKHSVRQYEKLVNGSEEEKGLAKHGIKTTIKSLTQSKGVEDQIEKLSEPRRSQALLLDATIKILDPMSSRNPDKKKVLTGLVVLIAAEIAKEYGENIWNPNHVRGESKTAKGSGIGSYGSQFFRDLLMDIALTSTNEMTLQDFLDYVMEARQFIRQQIYKNGKPTEKINIKHLFFQIEEFDILNFEKAANKLILDLENEIIARNRLRIEDLRKSPRAQTSSNPANSSPAQAGFYSKSADTSQASVQPAQEAAAPASP